MNYQVIQAGLKWGIWSNAGKGFVALDWSKEKMEDQAKELNRKCKW